MRRNIKSVFSDCKRIFGEVVSSKNMNAMVEEVSQNIGRFTLTVGRIYGVVKRSSAREKALHPWVDHIGYSQNN